MKLFEKLSLWAGRLRKAPERETSAYARLMSLGMRGPDKTRPLIKPTPANLRRFARTPYARRAINRIKNPIAQLKWEVKPKANVKESPELKRQIKAVTDCLNSPNNDDSYRSFVEQLIEDLLLCGGGTYEQQVGGNAIRPLWMWPVDALSIQIYPGWSGAANEARYVQTLGHGNVGGVQGRPLRNDELVYIRLNPSTETPFGYGPLEIAFNTINRYLGVADYAGNLASNAQPENMLFFEGMDQPTLQTFRNYWRDEIEGQGNTPIQGGPKDAKATVLKLRGTNDDALFLKYQEFIIREIAVSFEIFSLSLGLQQDVNRNTAEVAEDMDWDNTIIPAAKLIESYINRESIAARLGFSQIEFKLVGLDREDEKMTADIYEKYYKNNLTTPNEHREKMGMPPSESEWGDMTYVDVEIAKEAAKGAKDVLDDQLQNKQKTGRLPPQTK